MKRTFLISTIILLLSICNLSLKASITKTVGTSGADYSTLKAAFDAINAGTINTGVITLKIIDNTTETATAVLYQSGYGGVSNYSSVVIYPTVDGKTISGNLAAALIELNGADNVTIDGRVDASGSSPNLTITNTSTSSAAGTSTISFINSSENNTVQYCTIKGSETSASGGIILFSTSSAGNGNDNNTIIRNNISASSDANRPINALLSIGSSGSENSGNEISNNAFNDFFSRVSASYGINIGANSTSFSVVGNSFYETASFVPSLSVEYRVININNSTGNSFSINGNYIGGSAASCSGTFTKTNAANNTFYAIYANVGTTTTSNIQNNTIKNFSYNNSLNANWTGIHVAGGNVNIGITNGNIIGSSTGTGAVTINNTTTGGTVYGITIASSGIIDCQNNIVGSITTTTSATLATNFIGIYKTATAGNTTISNNIIGSTTTANSINTSSTSTSNSQLLYGIYSAGTGAVTIASNTIANITNNTTETTQASKVRGIITEGGSNTIENNDVYKLKTGGAANGSNYQNASLIGITQLSTTGGTTQSVKGNSVNNLENTATVKIEMYGIFYAGPATGTNVIERNFIHTFIIVSTDQAYLHGISLLDGSFTASNNIVFLGNNITTGCFIWGMWTNSNDVTAFYNNTIYLAGVATTGTSNTYAFRSLNSAVSSMTIENNILWNDRTNSPSSVSHYAIYLGTTTNVTADYNDFKFAQRFGRVGGTDYVDFASWKTGTSLDTNSLEVDPLLINLGGTLPSDYQTTVALNGTTGTGISTDIDYVDRSLTAPTMGAWEFFGNPVEVWNGPTYRASYSTLKGAFDKVNDGTWTGDLIIKLKGNTTETASAVLNASGNGAASYSQILIYPSRRGVRVSGNLTTPLIDLNGADNVTFDGRVNAAGDAYEFSFINTSISATAGTSTFRFINDATNNTIQYCNIKGSSTATASGVIFYSTTSQTTGNDDNELKYNNITNSSNANRPVNAIYAVGTATKENSGNIISNNNIYDYWRMASTSYGINIAGNTTDFTISDNSFYETTNFEPTGNYTYSNIYLNNTSGNNFVVSGNYIGGKEALCGGSALSLGVIGTIRSLIYYPIYVNVGTTTATSIQNNSIQNNSIRSSNANFFRGIHVIAGAVNIGTTTGNMLGASTGTSSLLLTATTNATNSYAIYTSSSGTVTISNNTIAAITTANTSAVNSHNFYGVYKSGAAGALTVSLNNIGSDTSSSIQTSSNSTTNPQNLFGIYSDATGETTIDQNVLNNLTNATTNAVAATTGRINGIVVLAGSTNTITKNTIKNLTIANRNTAANTNASVIGILLTGTSATKTISENTIFNLSNTYATFAGRVVGLYYAGSTSGSNVVTKNFIHSLSTVGTSSASLYGIWIVSGVTTYSNNIINLGSANQNIIYGVYDTGTASQTCNFYYNTIYIGGTTAGTQASYAFHNQASGNTRNYLNNIFCNARSRTGGSGKHYALSIQVTGGTLAVNYNDYRASGTGGVLGFFGADKTVLPIVTAQDANSITTNPTFTNPGSTVATDYMPGVALNCVIGGTGITVDYGSFSRGAPPTMGAWELNLNKWKGTSSNDWNTPSNWTGTLVPDPDATIIFDDAPVNHCQLDQNRSVTNIIINQSTYRMVLNGFKLTVKGNFNFTNGAQLDASANNSNLEFAGTSQSIPSGSLYNNNVFNLTINNPNNVILNGSLNLLNTITANAGKLDASTNLPSFSYSGTSSQSIEANRFKNDKAYNLIIDNSVGVTLNSDFTVENQLTINSGKQLTIPPAKLLNVEGTITNNAGTSGIIIESSSTAANGSLIFHNDYSSPVSATVQMYSKATWNTINPVGSRYKWQFYGIPVRTMNPSPAFDGAFVREWDESGTTIANHWIQLSNGSTMSSFLGYEIVKQVETTYSIEGELENSDSNFGQLAYTPTALYPGQHILSNPYTAAIDIRQLVFGSEMEWTVYLYNTGSYNDWYTEGGENNTGNNPGQYTSVPKNNAGYAGLPRQIPSMQAFLVKAMSNSVDATLSIQYNSVLMKNAELQRSKKFYKAPVQEKSYIILDVKGRRFSDRSWLFSHPDCTRSFDNGWDGEKFLGSRLAPQLYSVEADGDYQINTLNDINNTEFAFIAGEDSVYTLKLSLANLESQYPEIYLVDLKNDSVIKITSDEIEYTFKSLPSDTTKKRFKIVTSLLTSLPSAISTTKKINIFSNDKKITVNNTNGEKGNLMLYSISGQYLQNFQLDANTTKTIETTLIPGIYIVKLKTKNEEFTERLIIR